jgi:hypothetical protein
MTFSILIISITTFSIMTISIKGLFVTFGIMTLNIKGVFATFSIMAFSITTLRNQNDILSILSNSIPTLSITTLCFMLKVVMLGVTFYLLLC